MPNILKYQINRTSIRVGRVQTAIFSQQNELILAKVRMPYEFRPSSCKNSAAADLKLLKITDGSIMG